VVAQGDQCIAGQRGEEFDLEQLERQHPAGLPGRLERRHQRVDALAGDREVIDENRRVLVAGLEHRIVTLFLLAPQAELRAQAIVRQRRGKHLCGRCGKGSQQLVKALLFGRELGRIGVGSKGWLGHARLA